MTNEKIEIKQRHHTPIRWSPGVMPDSPMRRIGIRKQVAEIRVHIAAPSRQEILAS